MKVLITSGGTKVPIDDVRFIGNMSSGVYGAKLALAFLQEENNHVYFLMDKGSKHPATLDPGESIYDGEHGYFNDYEYKDYFEYKEKAQALIKAIQPDIIISAAAVSDYIVDKKEGKISSDGEQTIVLKPAEKVLASFRELAPKAFIVGFKLLVNPTEIDKRIAIDKVFKRGVDLVVYNDLAQIRQGNINRYIYDSKDFKYQVAESARNLSKIIYDEYSSRRNG